MRPERERAPASSPPWPGSKVMMRYSSEARALLGERSGTMLRSISVWRICHDPQCRVIGPLSQISVPLKFARRLSPSMIRVLNFVRMVICFPFMAVEMNPHLADIWLSDIVVLGLASAYDFTLAAFPHAIAERNIIAGKAQRFAFRTECNRGCIVKFNSGNKSRDWPGASFQFCICSCLTLKAQTIDF